MKRLNKKVGFIGAGNMAEAMINGLIKSGLCNPEDVWASDVRDARLSGLNHTYGIHTSKINRHIFEQTDVVILAVKPQHIADVLDDLSKTFPQTIQGVTLIISIAAGIPIKKIEAYLYPPLDQDAKGLLPIIRVMPNTPALALAGMAGMAGNAYAKPSDLHDARAILEAIGQVIEFEEKDLFAAVCTASISLSFM